MLFLIFAIISLVGAGFSLILLFCFQNPSFLLSFFSCIINAILFFALDFMRLDIKRHEKEISKLKQSLNEYREKFETPTSRKQCPACFYHIEKHEEECPNCGYKLK